MNKGKIILISGPSGTGKTTLIADYLSKREGLVSKVLSATTREPRKKDNGELEEHGVDYLFFGFENFHRLHFIEKNEVYKNKWYGTLFSSVIHGIESGTNMIKDLDIEGSINAYEQLCSMGYEKQVIQVGILPPNLCELKDRLKGRDGKVDPQRYERANLEINLIKNKISSEFIIENDNLDEAKKIFSKRLDYLYGIK